MIMHSHGWGGSRTTDPASFQKWLDAGYGVLSFDQRGFGESGGTGPRREPGVEGHDVRRLIALIADLPWVRQDGPGDPRLGAIGGSYGGGYQFLGGVRVAAHRRASRSSTRSPPRSPGTTSTRAWRPRASSAPSGRSP